MGEHPSPTLTERGAGPPKAPAGRVARRRALRVVLTLALVVAVFTLVLPTISGYGAVWRQLQTLTPWWSAALAAATVLNIVTFGFPWMVLIRGMTLIAALRVTQASTAFITVMPGGAPMGMAVSFGILRSLGIPSESAGFAVALTGIWNQVAIFLFPVAGLALVAANGQVSRPVAWIAAAGAVLAAVSVTVAMYALAGEHRARRFGDRLAAAVSALLRLVRRDPPGWGGDALVRIRREGLRLVRRHWLSLTLATLANQLTGYVMLDLSLRAVGIGFGQLSLSDTFAAWSLGRLAGSLPVTPAGIGLVELGLIGTLLGFGGSNAQVVAGVLLYRALVVVPPLVLGTLAALTWRRGRRSGARA